MNRTGRIAALDALYSELPRIECKRLCHDTCGPIGMSGLEHRRICETLGVRDFPCTSALDCSLLRDGLYSVYAIRPMICRLLGLSRVLPCPHGCEPERWLSQEEMDGFLRRAIEIGGDPRWTAPYELRAILPRAAFESRLAEAE